MERIFGLKFLNKNVKVEYSPAEPPKDKNNK